ncbi:copper resistance protein CopC [Micromonospora sp. DR5-3]|uniref:copper resistance CopC/CopD family protein n=1 Tax=unclassified Micromonospora TaxID=2617518 RepID=UPI0016524C95|nr:MULTISPECIES: copper resistance protein CopC [unclassified Micromonospora]MCW3820458.1 copper resistance protein CopC [Micromonospora sp. DR5-3]
MHYARHRWARLVTRLAVVVLLATGGLVTDLASTATTHPAYAHAYLLETSPVDGEVLASPPAEVRLRFDDAVSFNERSIQLLDTNAKKLAIGTPGHLDGKANTARVSLPTDLTEGTYVLAWRVTSADSHVVSGAFSFSIGHPSATAAPVEQDADRAVLVVDAVGRALAFLGVALALGGALFVAVLWPAGRTDRRGRRIVWSGFGVLTAGTVVVLLVQGPYAAGTSLAGVFDPDLLGAALSTRLGHALLARLVIVLALGVAFGIAVRPNSPSPSAPAATAGAGATRRIVLPAVAAVGAVALTLTWALADHAQTGVQTWLAVPATSLHLLAMALWLGGLITLAICVLIPTGRRETSKVITLEPALPRFSRLAQVCFAVVAATGVYLSWRQVGTWAAVGATDFGRLLLGKLAVVLAVVGLAAGARRFVRRRGREPLGLDAAPAAAVRWLRRSVVGEILLGVAVVSITAVLVNTAPARTSYAPPVHTTVPIPAAAAGSAAGLRDSSVEVKIEPARSGSNVADIYLTGPDGSLVAVPEISGQLESPDREVPALPITVTAAEPGHYVANSMSIPFPGVWVLRLDIRVSDFDETPVRVQFTAR